jgi:hypothetical protein
MNTTDTHPTTKTGFAQSAPQRTPNGDAAHKRMLADFDTGSTYVAPSLSSVSFMPVSELPAVEVTDRTYSVASIKRAEAKGYRVMTEQGGWEDITRVLIPVKAKGGALVPNRYQIKSLTQPGIFHNLAMSADETHFECDCEAAREGRYCYHRAIVETVCYMDGPEVEAQEASSCVDAPADSDYERFALRETITDAAPTPATTQNDVPVQVIWDDLTTTPCPECRKCLRSVCVYTTAYHASRKCDCGYSKTL